MRRKVHLIDIDADNRIISIVVNVVLIIGVLTIILIGVYLIVGVNKQATECLSDPNGYGLRTLAKVNHAEVVCSCHFFSGSIKPFYIASNKSLITDIFNRDETIP